MLQVTAFHRHFGKKAQALVTEAAVHLRAIARRCGQRDYQCPTHRRHRTFCRTSSAFSLPTSGLHQPQRIGYSQRRFWHREADAGRATGRSGRRVAIGCDTPNGRGYFLLDPRTPGPGDRRHLYRVLGRSPAAAETGYWAATLPNDGNMAAALRTAVLSSDEYFRTAEVHLRTVVAHDLSNETYVAALYNDVLQRPATPNEIAGYVSLLSSGVSRLQRDEPNLEFARTCNPGGQRSLCRPAGAGPNRARTLGMWQPC